MSEPASPIGKVFAWAVLLAFLLTLFMPLPAYALWRQYASLPAWDRDGVRTIGVIVDMREKVVQKGHHMEVWVEHRPGGGPAYRNWIDGGYITRLTGTSAHKVGNGLSLGDKIEIIYRPGDPRGQAILPQDLQPEGRVPFETPLFAGIMIGLWSGLVGFALALARMRLGLPNQI